MKQNLNIASLLFFGKVFVDNIIQNSLTFSFSAEHLNIKRVHFRTMLKPMEQTLSDWLKHCSRHMLYSIIHLCACILSLCRMEFLETRGFTAFLFICSNTGCWSLAFSCDIIYSLCAWHEKRLLWLCLSRS